MAIKRAPLFPFIFFCDGPLLRLCPCVARGENLYSNLFLPLCLLFNSVTPSFFNGPTGPFCFSPPWARFQVMTCELIHPGFGSQQDGRLSFSTLVQKYKKEYKNKIFQHFTFPFLHPPSIERVTFFYEGTTLISNINALPFCFWCINLLQLASLVQRCDALSIKLAWAMMTVDRRTPVSFAYSLSGANSQQKQIFPINHATWIMRGSVLFGLLRSCSLRGQMQAMNWNETRNVFVKVSHVDEMKDSPWMRPSAISENNHYEGIVVSLYIEASLP